MNEPYNIYCITDDRNTYMDKVHNATIDEIVDTYQKKDYYKKM